MRKIKWIRNPNGLLYRIRHRTIKTAIGDYWEWYIETKAEGK